MYSFEALTFTGASVAHLLPGRVIRPNAVPRFLSVRVHLYKVSTSLRIAIGKLPKRCDEQALWAMVNEPAPAYEMRIMIDFSGETRGFAFVVYRTKEEAKV